MASSKTLFTFFMCCAFGLLGTGAVTKAPKEPKLIITPQEPFVYALVDESFTISCAPESGYVDAISWVDPLNRTIGYVRNMRSYSDGPTRKLLFGNPKSSDSGEYTCRANLGRYDKSKTIDANIYVRFMNNDTSNDTGSIESFRVVKVTENSVQFDIHTSGNVEDIQVQYFEKLTTRITTISQRLLGTKYEIRGLVPSGEYTFQFMPVVPQDGIWTKAVKVTLLPDVPNVILHSLKDGMLDIEYLRTDYDIRRGTIDQFLLSYFTVQMKGGNYWINSTCVININIPFCRPQRYSLADLSKNSFYEVQLRAHTSSGFGQPYRQKINLWR